MSETPNINSDAQKYLDSHEFRRDFFAYSLPESERKELIFLERTALQIQNLTETAEPEEYELWRHYPLIGDDARFPQRFIAALYNFRRGLNLDFNKRFLDSYRAHMIHALWHTHLGRMNCMICRRLIGCDEPFAPLKFGGLQLPRELNAVAATPWNVRNFATPVANVDALRHKAMQTFKQEYDRMTLSHSDFDDMIRTEEFLDRLRQLHAWATLDMTTPIHEGWEAWRKLAERVLEIQIELTDALFVSHDYTEGAIRKQVLPRGVVMLSNTEDDNNADSLDFFTASPPDEDVKKAGLPTRPRHRGALAYIEARSHLNPPEILAKIRYYGAPRKHKASMVAVLRVGMEEKG